MIAVVYTELRSEHCNDSTNTYQDSALNGWVCEAVLAFIKTRPMAVYN